MLGFVSNKYFVGLLVIAIMISVIELFFPFIKNKKKPVKWITDGIYQIFNFSIFGVYAEVLVFAFYSFFKMDKLSINLFSVDYFKSLHIVFKFIIFLIIIDFFEYCIHNLLHRIPVLWEFHKVHHSIKHLDWWGNMLFHPIEILVYQFFIYLPLILFNPYLPETAFFVLVMFRLTIGTFAHSNLKIDIGPFKYFINNPKVHCWHHANDERAINKNLGITFTFWDFIFNTAVLPKDEAFPKKGLGFLNDSEYQPFMNQIFKPIMKLTQLKVEKQRAL